MVMVIHNRDPKSTPQSLNQSLSPKPCTQNSKKPDTLHPCTLNPLKLCRTKPKTVSLRDTNPKPFRSRDNLTHESNGEGLGPRAKDYGF